MTSQDTSDVVARLERIAGMARLAIDTGGREDFDPRGVEDDAEAAMALITTLHALSSLHPADGEPVAPEWYAFKVSHTDNWSHSRLPPKFDNPDQWTVTPLYTRPSNPVSAEVTEAQVEALYNAVDDHLKGFIAASAIRAQFTNRLRSVMRAALASLNEVG